MSTLICKPDTMSIDSLKASCARLSAKTLSVVIPKEVPVNDVSSDSTTPTATPMFVVNADGQFASPPGSPDCDLSLPDAKLSDKALKQRVADLASKATRAQVVQFIRKLVDVNAVVSKLKAANSHLVAENASLKNANVEMLRQVATAVATERNLLTENAALKQALAAARATAPITATASVVSSMWWRGSGRGDDTTGDAVDDSGSDASFSSVAPPTPVAMRCVRGGNDAAATGDNVDKPTCFVGTVGDNSVVAPSAGGSMWRFGGGNTDLLTAARASLQAARGADAAAGAAAAAAAAAAADASATCAAASLERRRRQFERASRSPIVSEQQLVQQQQQQGQQQQQQRTGGGSPVLQTLSGIQSQVQAALLASTDATTIPVPPQLWVQRPAPTPYQSYQGTGESTTSKKTISSPSAAAGAPICAFAAGNAVTGNDSDGACRFDSVSGPFSFSGRASFSGAASPVRGGEAAPMDSSSDLLGDRVLDSVSEGVRGAVCGMVALAGSKRKLEQDEESEREGEVPASPRTLSEQQLCCPPKKRYCIRGNQANKPVVWMPNN